ncbi:Ankyrin-1 [Arthrobotrys entomopaga]|nr:Ankyrin-1 [Arthrobotrys entomopaga]
MDARRPSYEHHAEASSSHPPKRQKSSYDDFYDAPGESRHGSLGPRYDRYTIAWICALSIEMAAALAMLDDVHETLATYTTDSNTYRLGSIKGHNVVVACLPNAQYGTNNAANVLTNLTRTFPSIRLGLMVGIGGGVPSMADIRLGDIVVGTRVMQYDLGKIVEDGEILRTAVPKTPHQQLNTAVSALRADHELAPSSVPSILREKLGEYPEYGLPTLPDHLFAATYPHTSYTHSCDKCEKSKLVPRSARPSSNPTIHYGVIASGNQVMKSGTLRDNVARQLDALCFEMEAAGLMDILPCLPIRGICDYSDSHKNKGWQKYAAATAAAYARELLGALPTTKNTTRVAYALRTHQVSSHDNRSRLLDSLRYEQIDSRRLTIKAAHAKTCEWFLSHPDYKAWLDPTRLLEHHGFLWIRGKPGAGKSTLMKFLYSRTKKRARSNNLIASFFFNARGEQLEKSISGMYRSLLLQLLEGCPALQTVLDDPELVPRNQNGCPCLNVLRDLFCEAVSNLGQRPFTCFIDALDECDEQQIRTMVQDLEDLAEKSTQTGVSLRICFSSRHYPYIIIRRGLQLTLEDQSGHAEDLASYVRSRLNIKNAVLIEELQAQILGKAAGVFLWIVLVVDILNKENQRGRLAMKQRLAELPSDLSELFKDMLRRDQENMEHLLLCIIWILCAIQPLTPQAYYHALWSGLLLKGLADDELPDITGSDAVETINSCIISSSKGLAEITKSKHPTVQFIHESVRDFLIKDKGLHELWPDLGFDWESPGHEMLKQCCQTYLNKMRGNISKEYSFLEYASQNILLHADGAANTIPQLDFISKFSVPSWIEVVNFFEKYEARRYKKDQSLLCILAERNLANLIRIHPDRTFWLREEVGRYGNPLFTALALGSHNAVQALLEIQAQAEPNEPLLLDLCKLYSENENLRLTFGRSFKFPIRTQKTFLEVLEERGDVLISVFIICSISENIGTSSESRHTKALLCAAKLRHEKLVRLLLETDANIERADAEDRTPLSHMASSGFETVVQLLLERGADVMSKSRNGRTPLSYAAELGNEAIVQMLLDRNSDIESKTIDAKTPLMFAIAGDHEAVVKLLLERGADVMSKSTTGRTPLLYAAEWGNETIVQMLLDRNSDIEAKDKDGWGPLIFAVDGNHEAVVKLLLARGADTEKKWKGRTPLIHATRRGYETICQLLLATEHINPNSKDDNGGTPLSYAAESGLGSLVQLLLANERVDPDSRDNKGRTPLSYAAEFGRNTSVTLLLANKRVDPDSRDNEGRTPLSYAAESGHNASVILLLANKLVDPDSRDNEGRTPLSYAANRKPYFIQRLANERVDDSRDNKGPTPLPSVMLPSVMLPSVIYLSDSPVKLLVANKHVDPDSRDNEGRTPLSYAAERGNGDMARLLYATGKVDLDSKCNDGRTPLSYAQTRWPSRKISGIDDF